MATHSLTAAFHSLINSNLITLSKWRWLLLVLTAAPLVATAQELLPYTAIYTSSKSGLTVDMEQTFTPLDDQRWRLQNHTSVWFGSLEEATEFRIDDNLIKPLQYDYKNTFNRGRNSRVRFNWDKQQYTDELHSKKPSPLNQPTWDKLSVQAQLRLDLLNQGADFEEKTYPQVDRTRIKDYVVTRLGEETLQTPLGTFKAVKLQQRRPDRDEYTLTWAATEWNFLILKLQRIEDGKVEYEINIKEATLAGRPVQGD